MIEHLPQELRDRFTEMREMDLSVQSKSQFLSASPSNLNPLLCPISDVMDSLEKRVRMFFSQCRRNELPQGQADTEFTNVRRDYYKVLEDADEKVQLSSQMYDLVERYLRRLDSELHKFKCELEADHNGITEILEKRSLELDGNSSNSNSVMNNILSVATTNHSQKENRYFGSVSSGGGASNSNSHGSMRDRDSHHHRYNRHKAEKRRDSNNGPSSMTGAPPEKRQMLSSSMNHSNSISGIHSGGGSSQGNNLSALNSMGTIRSGGQNVSVSVHYGGGGGGSNASHSHHHHGGVSHSSSSSSSSSGQNSNLQSSLIHSASSSVGNPVIVTTTLGTGVNAVNLGTTAYTAESEVMRAASQAIAMTHQMQQGRRTASLKASVEAATSGGVAGVSGQDVLGRELVGATHNAIQAVERESFNSNQRRHKK